MTSNTPGGGTYTPPPPPPPPPPQPPPVGNAGDLIYPSSPPKDPAIALIINLFFSGIGQIYLGQIAKGLVIFFGSAVFWMLTLLLSAFCVGVLLVPMGVAIYAGAIVDGYQQGRHLQMGHPIGQWTFFNDHR